MKRSRIIILVSILLGIDLLIKYFVSVYLTNIVVIKNFFSLTYVLNDGAAFSIFSSRIYLLILISFLCLFFIIRELNNNLNDKVLSVGYSLILSGLLGNLIDRLIDGYIVDYLAFKIFGFNYPVFNLADILIVGGVFIVIIKTLRESRGGVKNEIRSRK